ncbi:serine hydrolase domain-containing protein [Streptomyces sp. 4N509B]|uniref:serine hydrolase domain-containing protein n=1 Tax=Streptomyces sp. 4N509B TaxID=3457413 RepID=UPI003FD071EA
MRPIRAVTAAVLAAAALLATACGGVDREREETPSAGPGADAGTGTGTGTDTDAGGALARYLDAHWPADAPGTVLVAHGEDTVRCQARGLADRAAHTPATCDTVYDIGSITKSFTAAAILKLEMMGELSVTDRISAHLGPVPDDKRAITVHHLLTHTAGLPEALGDDYEETGRDAMVAAALRAPLRSTPGTTFHYSNAGYSLLAAIVERASGTGYEEFLNAHLLTPAGMTDTGYVLPDWDRDQVAVEYDERGAPRGRPQEHPWAADGPHWHLRGNGGLLSTARDMYRWHQALRGDAVLDEHARRALVTRHVSEGGGSFYGYGWSVPTLDGVGEVATHNGGNGWSYARVVRGLDEDLMIFWASSQAHRAGGPGQGWNLEETDLPFCLGLAGLATGG